MKKYGAVIALAVIVIAFIINPIIGFLVLLLAVFVAWCAMKYTEGATKAMLYRELKERERERSVANVPPAPSVGTEAE